MFEGVRLLNILEPGADYGARANLVDLRFTKILDLEGRVRVRPMLDLYNVFNDNTTTRENIATGENYLVERYAFIQDFVVNHIDGIRLRSDDRGHICPKCGARV